MLWLNIYEQRYDSPLLYFFILALNFSTTSSAIGFIAHCRWDLEFKTRYHKNFKKSANAFAPINEEFSTALKTPPAELT